MHTKFTRSQETNLGIQKSIQTEFSLAPSSNNPTQKFPNIYTSVIIPTTRVAPRISNRRLTLPTRWLKHGYLNTINGKNIRKNSFSPSNVGLASSNGGLYVHSSPSTIPAFKIYCEIKEQVGRDQSTVVKNFLLLAQLQTMRCQGDLPTV